MAHAEVALRFLAGCWRFWQMRGYLTEAREQAERILAMPGAADHPGLRLKALDAAGGIAYWQGDLPRSREWYVEERELAAQLGDRATEVQSIYNQSMTYATGRDDVPRARSLSQEALAGYRELGDRHGEGLALWGLVNSYIFEADVSEALELADESIAIFRETNDRFMLAWALFTRALGANQQRDLEMARRLLTEALQIFRENKDVSGYALVLDGFGTLAWLEGDADLAVRISGAAAAIQDLSGVGLAEVNRNIAGFFPRELAAQGPLAAIYEEGKRLTAEQAVALALGEETAQPQPASDAAESAAANEG